jgi:hypothetical protein
MSDLPSSFEDRLEARIAASRRRQQEASADLAAIFREAEREQAAQVRAGRLSATRSSPGAPRHSAASNRFSLPVQAQMTLGNADLLQRLDAVMWETFELEPLFPNAPLGQYPVVYCETLAEFFTPILADLDVSASTREELLAAWIDEAEAHAQEHGGGIFGVNLPGRGCYVNGWLFGFAHDKPPRTALQDPAIFPTIMETVCHEKLGHGFIATLTAVGQEKRQLGLWRFEWAQRFNLRTVDSPRSALLEQKHRLVHESSKFTEEGWATWIEQFMIWLGARQGLLPSVQAAERLQAKYALEPVVQVLEELRRITESQVREAVEAFQRATEILLVSEDASEEELFGAVRLWQDLSSQLAEFDAAFESVFGQPTLYVLGYLLLRRLEARLGWANLPCAVAIAGNVTYDLETTSLVDLATLVGSNARLNVDARLALLGSLRLEPDQGPGDLARLAREALNLAVPEGWG